MDPFLLSTRSLHKNLCGHPVLTLFRRTLLTIRSQPSSRKLDQESTFPGGTLTVMMSYRQIIQRDNFRAIMVDLEPTVVDEVGLKLFSQHLFCCLTIFFSLSRWELVLIANSSIQASWSLGRRWSSYIRNKSSVFPFAKKFPIGRQFERLSSRTLPTTMHGGTTLWERSRSRCLVFPILVSYLILGLLLHLQNDLALYLQWVWSAR